MKKLKTIEVPENVIENITCDKCGKVSEDGFIPYIHTISIDWGYGSKFDTEKWEIDLCENCLVQMLENSKIKIERAYDEFI